MTRATIWTPERRAMVAEMYPRGDDLGAIFDAICALPGFKPASPSSLFNFISVNRIRRNRPNERGVQPKKMNTENEAAIARQALTGEAVVVTVKEAADYIRRYAPHLRSLAELQFWRHDRGLPPFDVVMRPLSGDVGIGADCTHLAGRDKPKQKKKVVSDAA